MLVEMGEQTRFLDFCWENTKKWQFSKEEGGGGGGRGGGGGGWGGGGGKPNLGILENNYSIELRKGIEKP